MRLVSAPPSAGGLWRSYCVPERLMYIQYTSPLCALYLRLRLLGWFLAPCALQMGLRLLGRLHCAIARLVSAPPSKRTAWPVAFALPFVSPDRGGLSAAFQRGSCTSSRPQARSAHIASLRLAYEPPSLRKVLIRPGGRHASVYWDGLIHPSC